MDRFWIYIANIVGLVALILLAWWAILVIQ